MPFDSSQNFGGPKSRSIRPDVSPSFSSDNVHSVSLREGWPNNADTVRIAAASPAHGCCDEESAEDYERWDGMS